MSLLDSDPHDAGELQVEDLPGPIVIDLNDSALPNDKSADILLGDDFEQLEDHPEYVDTSNIKSEIENVDTTSPNIESTETAFTQDQNKFSCALCSYETKIKFNMQRHSKTHFRQVNTQKRAQQNVKPIFKCEKCSYTCHQNSLLQRHMIFHSDTYYKCGYCKFSTKYRRNLPKHVLRHKLEPKCQKFTCDKCDYACKDKMVLQTHMLTHRKPEKAPNNFIKKDQLLNNDTKSHSGNAPSPMCPERILEEDLPIHLKSHEPSSKINLVDINFDDEEPQSDCPDLIDLKELKEIIPNKAFDLSLSVDDNVESTDIQFKEKKNFSCALCSYKTKLRLHMIEHTKSHYSQLNTQETLKPKFKCDKCPYEHHYQSSLVKHMKVHSDTYYRCAHCDFSTKYKENLPKHLRIHKPPSECRMFKCDECDYASKERLTLKRHMLTHRRLEEVEHFNCSLCNFATKHQISYNNHMLKIHNKDIAEKYQCPECEFFTYHKISLKNHIITHRKPGEVPMHKCSKCPYETKNKQALQNHSQSHMGNVPCPKCQKMITRRGMRLHLKSHESDDVRKKYKCKHCDYGTLYYGNFTRHIKIMHSKNKMSDYKHCPDCPFKTLENARLKRHIKELHSDDPPEFKCDHCSFKSKFNSCLKRHVETAHINTDPVTCPECHKPSANIYTLRIHLKLHRKGKFGRKGRKNRK